MGTPKESSNIDSARGNSMSIQNGYIQRVQFIKIGAKADHHNYGTSQFGYGRKVSFTAGNTTIKAQHYNIFNDYENRVRDIFGTTQFRHNDQIAVISGQHIFKGFCKSRSN